jgi:hypothetical protein
MMVPSKMKLDDQQDLTVRRALIYWDERWDWECPSLFGLSHEQYGIVVRSWPGKSDAHLLAASAALRELLYGASALHDCEAVRAVLGADKASVVTLLETLMGELDKRASCM